MVKQLGALLLTLFAASPAAADELAIAAGTGVERVTGDAGATVDPAGAIDLRVISGSDVWLGAEAAYVGTVGGIADATLVGATFEGTMRANLVVGRRWQPYVFGGIGWRRYEVIGEMTVDRDDQVVFPLGVGLALLRDRLYADVRATARPAIEQDLVGATRMHTVGASARLGVRF